MPNHVTNRVTFDGDPEMVKRLREAIASPLDPDKLIDFKEIIPMPTCLENLHGDGRNHLYRIPPGFDGVPSWEVPEESIIPVNALERATIRLRTGGYQFWYEWCVDNWGTKWNAYDQRIDDLGRLVFSTAWSTPVPVFEELSRQWPEVMIQVEFADEDFGVNCGAYMLEAGEVMNEYLPTSCSTEAEDWAADVLGYDPREEDDEEEVYACPV